MFFFSLARFFPVRFFRILYCFALKNAIIYTKQADNLRHYNIYVNNHTLCHMQYIAKPSIGNSYFAPFVFLLHAQYRKRFYFHRFRCCMPCIRISLVPTTTTNCLKYQNARERTKNHEQIEGKNFLLLRKTFVGRKISGKK